MVMLRNDVTNININEYIICERPLIITKVKPDLSSLLHPAGDDSRGAGHGDERSAEGEADHAWHEGAPALPQSAQHSLISPHLAVYEIVPRTARLNRTL